MVVCCSIERYKCWYGLAVLLEILSNHSQDKTLHVVNRIITDAEPARIAAATHLAADSQTSQSGCWENQCSFSEENAPNYVHCKLYPGVTFCGGKPGRDVGQRVILSKHEVHTKQSNFHNSMMTPMHFSIQFVSSETPTKIKFQSTGLVLFSTYLLKTDAQSDPAIPDAYKNMVIVL